MNIHAQRDTAPAAGGARPAPPQSGVAAGGGVKAWSGGDINATCETDELLSIYARWTELAQDGLPRLSEMVEPNPMSALANASLLLRLPTDFIYLFHGPAAARALGHNLTGRLLSEVKSQNSHELRTLYASALDRVHAIYLRFVSQLSEQHFSFEQLVLPVAGDETRGPSFILSYLLPLDDKIAVLRAVFEHSPIGMIATTVPPVGGGMQDGRILMINKPARRMLKIPDSIGRINTIRDLGPWFRDGALWTKTDVIAEGRQTHVHYRDRATNVSYRVTLEPLERFMLFSIIEIGK